MSQEKTGKYVECALPKCSKTEYRPPYLLKRHGHVYCCPEHGHEHKKILALEKRPCCNLPGCDKPVPKPSAKYCGRKHFFQHRSQKASWIKCECANCSTVFDRLLSTILHSYKLGSKNFYCNNKCKEEHWNKVHNVQLNCRHCGNSFSRCSSYHSICTNNFCTRKCYDDYLETYGSPLRMYPKTAPLRKVIQEREASRQLKDYYVACTLGLPVSEVPEELLQEQRMLLTLKRKLKLTPYEHRK